MDSNPPTNINNLLKDAKEFVEAFDQSLDILDILEDFLYTINDIIENVEIDMKYHVEFQDQFFKWHRYQTLHNEQNAYRTANNRYKSTGKRHRITDDEGHIIDIIG
jgi:hypothetical protein